ncbi:MULTISPECIES: FAD-dependent oxidoreductase [Clostridia]|uniref:glycerol-3-phosphate dehydrogenase/oxidase n=1 Tax=Clostridia TaxID=186801 RepID=UPI000EA0D1AC|nr:MULTISPECIES: FAD-dependent oxidoreductase [Clostridia]NBJ69630.1 glycerol-3-phosphate dehydrogenase/oxidase [Roseburia sp. 1XD42-34]RKI78314.1 glycerol-3-phosphate dehydrogenase/oxidase [Clostridium sp. 1xD42-85]
MNIFSSFQRQDKLTNMEKKQLDLLVIGGGITGSGIALDAVMRGMNIGLVEMQDFAAGTSSRSTKLVHGGLRYLKQMEVKMVAEVGRERAVVYENGPHVTTPEWMMLPFHKGGTFGPFTTNIGLRVYDLLAGVKKSERRKMLNKEEARAKEPLIKQDGLKGAGYYVEYKTDDARLTIEVLKKAVQKGVHAVNYAKVVDFIYNENQQIAGAVIEDQIHGKHYRVYAKKIINAGGPWVDELREIDGSKQGKALHLTKGVHLVFSKKVFPLQQAIYFDSPDGRMIFAIPRENVTYVGTTDTSYKGDIANPTMTVADRDYILDAIHYMFPSLNITADHVESSWAGLRPLIAEEGTDNPSEISRKDEIFISDSGLISMAGGKLTGYRKMAEEAVDTVAKRLKEEEGILYSKSDTVHLPISGGEVGGSKGFAKFIVRKTDEAIAEGMDEATAKRLIHRYGANFDQILELYRNKQQEASDKGMDRCLLAELIYAMEFESAYKPVDFFIRRTSALFFEIDWVRAHQEKVIAYMAKELKWTEEQTEEYTNELNLAIDEAVHPQPNN